MVEDSVHSEYKETYQEFISSEMFECLDMHSYSKKINVEFSAEYYTRWFVTYHWFSKAKCIYWYDSAIKTATPSNVLTKSKRIPVTITLEFRKLSIYLSHINLV